MITDLPSFVDYVRLMLGAGVNNVELNDTLILQAISDSTDIFVRYNYAGGSYRDTYTLNVSAGVSAYYLDPSVIAILDIQNATGDNNINKLFTVQHNLLYQSFYNGGVVGNGNGGEANMGQAYVMGSYTMSMMYLQDINNTFLRQYTCQYSENTNTVRIWPTPEISGPVMLTIWKKEVASDLFNHILLKKMIVAKCKIIWGETLGKYNISLPGTGQINYQMFIDRGEKEYADALEAIIMESVPPIFICG